MLQTPHGEPIARIKLLRDEGRGLGTYEVVEWRGGDQPSPVSSGTYRDYFQGRTAEKLIYARTGEVSRQGAPLGYLQLASGDAKYLGPVETPSPARFERTPAGDQAVIPGAGARAIPTGPIRAAAPQADVTGTPLFGQERAAREQASDAAQTEFSAHRPLVGSAPVTAAGTGTGTATPGERSQLMERMQEIIDRPIRTGRMAQPRSVRGLFKTKPEVIRLRIAHDIQTLAHEAGHYVSKLLFGPPQGRPSPARRAFFNAHAAELDALSQSHADPTPEEGFAEFWRHYLTDAAAARQQAPGLFTAVEDVLGRQDADLLAAFQGFRDEYQAWRAQDPTGRLRSHIAFDVATSRPGVKETLERLYTGLINELAPIDRAVTAMLAGRPLSADRNPAMLAQTLAGAPRLVDLFLFRGRQGQGGAIDFTTRRKVGPALEEILEPVRDQWRDWSVYMVARRMDELIQRADARAVRSREALFTALEMRPADVHGILDGLQSPAFDRAAEQFQNWNEALLRYIHDAGLISGEAMEQIRALNQNYFPFYRFFGSAEEGAQPPSTGGRATANVRSPVKGLKGSGRLFDNPLHGAIRNATMFVMRAERNAVARAMADLADKTDGGGQWMERVPAESQVTTFQLEEIRRYITQALTPTGATPEHIQAVQAMLDNADLSLLARVFRPDRWRTAENEVWVLRKGEPVHYIVEPNLFRTLKGLDRGEVAWLDQFLRSLPDPKVIPFTDVGLRSLIEAVILGPPRLLRAGATLAPEFLARNPIRDVFTRAAFPKTPSTLPPPFGPWSDLVHAFLGFGRGVLDAAKEGPGYDAWVRGGGALSTLASLDRKHLDRSLDQVLAGRRVNPWNPVELLRVISGTMEEANRIAEDVSVLEARGTSPGAAGKAALIEAGQAGREGTIDFNRVGAWVKGLAINRLVAFCNPNVQGYDKMFREARESPWRFLPFVLSVITLPSILLWLFQHDDPRWEEIPQWQRDISWIWLRGSVSREEWTAMSAARRREMAQTTIVRLPKPFELGVLFGSVPERILEWTVGQNPEIGISLLKTFGAVLGSALLPIPTTLEPILANLMNYSRFLDRPVETRQMREVEPVERYGPGTSHTARWLARTFNAIPGAPEMLRSPLQLDTLMRAWTGGLGRLTADMVDLAVKSVQEGPPEPSATAADIPGIRGFVVRYPTSQAESVQAFYRIYDHAQEVGKTLTMKRRLGRDATGYANEHVLEVATLPALRDVAKVLSAARAGFRDVYESRDLTPEAKRDRLDELTLQMIDVSREVVRGYRDLETRLARRAATRTAE